MLHAVVLGETAESISEQNFLCKNFIKATWSTMMNEKNNTFLILLTFHLGTFQCGPYAVQPEHASEILRNFGRTILLFLMRLKFAYFEFISFV